MNDVDPSRCPLCGGPNGCGMAAQASTCWCFVTHVPPDVRERIPAEARDVACVCQACAEGRSAPASAPAPTAADQVD